MHRLRCLLLLAMLLTVPLGLLAQTEMDERAMIYSFRGIQYATKDTSFYINFRFRMQPRIGVATRSGDDFTIEQVEARIRRLRFRVDGFIVSRRLSYSIQLSFARADTDFDNTGYANIIRDAVIFYQLHKNFYVAFGLNKLPGNRQRVISSGMQQFADRSIVNATFNIDRDLGIKGYYSTTLGKVGMNLKGAVTTGEGRSVSFTDPGLAYTLRGELLPLGAFTGDGDYSEGDLEREPKPRLSIAGGYCYNAGTRRTAGQLGRELYAPRDMAVAFADLLLKYRGWALAAELMHRDTPDPITYNSDSTSVRYMYKGWGATVQTSYLLPRNYELALRYSLVTPHRDISHLERRSDMIELGATRYINKQRIKAQFNLNYLLRDGRYAASNPGNQWGALLQVEIGI